MFLQCPLILCSPFATNDALRHGSVSVWFLGGVVYQIVARAPEHFLNIHVKPEAVLHVGRSGEEPRRSGHNLSAQFFESQR